MKPTDARSLSPEALQALRERVIAAVEGGMSKSQAARVFNLNRNTVNRWHKNYKEGGKASLVVQTRGRKPKPVLDEAQRKQLIDTITHKTPEQVNGVGYLWTRAEVASWAQRELGITCTVKRWGKILAEANLTPQVPARKSVKQNPHEVAEFVEKTFPEVQKQAQEEQAEVFFLDESGLRSDCTSGRSYAPRGRTPTMPVSGKRFGVSFIAAVCAAGMMSYSVYTGRFNGKVMIEYLERLLAERAGKKVYVVLDNHPVHTSNAVKEWAEKNEQRIRLVYLPKYSPEINPVEYLNGHVKANVQRTKRAANQQELADQTRAFLAGIQSDDRYVCRYFLAPHAYYAS
jgi:transposase